MLLQRTVKPLVIGNLVQQLDQTLNILGPFCQPHVDHRQGTQHRQSFDLITRCLAASRLRDEDVNSWSKHVQTDPFNVSQNGQLIQIMFMFTYVH